MGVVVDIDEFRHPSGRVAAGTPEDPLHVTRDDQDVPLGLLIRLVGLTFLGYVVMTAGVFWWLTNNQNNARFKDQREFAAQLAQQNTDLTKRLNNNRAAQAKRIQTAVANLCASAELRDTVIARQNTAIVALLETIPPPVPPKVQNLIDASRDGIRTLEPVGEGDCPLPPENP